MERETRPREHEGFSQIIVSLLTVLCSTGTILRRKGNGRGQKYGEGKVKTRTLEPEGGSPARSVLFDYALFDGEAEEFGIVGEAEVLHDAVFVKGHGAGGYVPMQDFPHSFDQF